jgi:hypothetical protein
MPSARRVHFLRKLTYSLHLLSGRRPYHLLRLLDEANCLTVQHTKQNLRPQLPYSPKTKLPLPRERFSPRVDPGRLLVIVSCKLCDCSLGRNSILRNRIRYLHTRESLQPAVEEEGRQAQADDGEAAVDPWRRGLILTAEACILGMTSETRRYGKCLEWIRQRTTTSCSSWRKL